MASHSTPSSASTPCTVASGKLSAADARAGRPVWGLGEPEETLSVFRRRGSVRSERTELYDEAVPEALVVLWEASDRVCGKRLKPLLPLRFEALGRRGHLQLDDVVRTKLQSASASTIDRLLAEPRGSAG